MSFLLDFLLLRFYSKKKLTEEKIILNYPLSRKGHVTVNAFRISMSRFRIFANKPIRTPDKASDIVMATLALNNC